MKKGKRKSILYAMTACTLAACLFLSGCEVSNAAPPPGTDATGTTSGTNGDTTAGTTTTGGTSSTAEANNTTSTGGTTTTTSGTDRPSNPLLGLVENRYTQGLSEVQWAELYENGSRVERDSLVNSRDNKVFYVTNSNKRVINYADGYLMDLPLDLQPDYSLSPVRSRYSNGDIVLTVTKESIPENYSYDVLMDECYNPLLKDDEFIRNNNITRVSSSRATYNINKLTGDNSVGSYLAEFFTLRLNNMSSSSKSLYNYVILSNRASDTYYFFLCKSNKPVDIKAILDSFQVIEAQGEAVYNVSYNLQKPSNWSKETSAYYDKLANQDHIDWGLFSGPTNRGDLSDIQTFGQKTGYDLPIVSVYRHVWEGFPWTAAENTAASGRQLQFTYQFTDNNNTDVKNSHSEALDVYRGYDDGYLYGVARAIKSYGKPVLFRLNNEMNTDWTSYSASATMLDPDIFIDNWIRLYKIFEDEGVDNAIWIFNPNGMDCPQAKWASFHSYMPPAQYVQMLGITGYVTGHSGFPSFEQVYSELEENYEPFFGDWPWIISEFACGTGDQTKIKEQTQWVNDMFDCLASGRFPNIKGAVWFSGNDYKNDGTISNEFQLNFNNSALMKAFRDGLARTH
jgi:mannan endo-1,4-beta-mannosidase